MFLIAAAYPFRLRYADIACGVVRQSSISASYYVPLAGIEPATFRSGGERTIHCATGAKLTLDPYIDNRRQGERASYLQGKHGDMFPSVHPNDSHTLFRQRSAQTSRCPHLCSPTLSFGYIVVVPREHQAQRREPMTQTRRQARLISTCVNRTLSVPPLSTHSCELPANPSVWTTYQGHTPRVSASVGWGCELHDEVTKLLREDSNLQPSP